MADPDLVDDLRKLVEQLRNANRSARNGANRADRANDGLKTTRRDAQAGAYKDAAARLASVLRRHTAGEPSAPRGGCCCSTVERSGKGLRT